MVYPIYVYGTNVLRKRAKDIEKNDENLPQLIDDMFETMKFSEGVGLAAPQIGKSLRLFVIDASEIDEENEEYVKGFKKAFVNPLIVERTGEKWTFNEGCLSIPHIHEDVDRPEKVRIQYYDPEWNFYDEVYEGIPARIIQHEYDHLEGILFVDRLSPLRKRLLNGKLGSISKGKVDTSYKIKIPTK